MASQQLVLTTSDLATVWRLPGPTSLTVELPKVVGTRLDGCPVYQGSRQLVATWEVLTLGEVETLFSAYFGDSRGISTGRVAVTRRLYAWNEQGQYCLFPDVAMLLPTIGSRETMYARNVELRCRRLRTEYSGSAVELSAIAGTAHGVDLTATVGSGGVAVAGWNPYPFAGYRTTTGYVPASWLGLTTGRLPEGVSRLHIRARVSPCSDAPNLAATYGFLTPPLARILFTRHGGRELGRDG